MIFPRWKFLIAAALTAFCGTFQMAYNFGVINLPEDVFLEFMNETNIQRYGTPMSEAELNILWGVIVSITSVGGIIGTLVTPFLAEKSGRKMSLLVWSNVVAIGSSLLMSFCQAARSYEMLAVGRFVNGVGMGVATTILPVYLSECSPSNYRGLMGGLQTISVNSQTVLAFVVSLPSAWGNAACLPLLLGLGIVPAVLQILSAFVLPESPKYLYIKKKDVVGAEKSVRFWSADRDPTSKDMKTIFEEFDQEAEILAQEVGFLRAIRIPYFRRVFFVSSIILASQAFTAVGPVFSYSTEMFLRLGYSQANADLCTNMLAVVNTLGAFVTTPFVERYSRRAFFFSGYIVLLLSMLAYTFLYAAYDMTGSTWTAYAAVISLLVYCVAYNMGSGLLTWILPSELAPQAIRSTVVSVSYAVGWALALITTSIFPSAESMLGAWSYFMYIIPLIICLVYLYKVMPETGRKNVAQLVREISVEKQNVEGKHHDSIGHDSGYWGDGLVHASKNSMSKDLLQPCDPEDPASKDAVYIIGRNVSVERF